jgi:hypothetical protein
LPAGGWARWTLDTLNDDLGLALVDGRLPDGDGQSCDGRDYRNQGDLILPGPEDAEEVA